MLDEVVFIVGPVLVTFLATSLHPALGIATSGAIGSGGRVGPGRPARLAAADPSQRPTPRRTSRSCRVRILLPVAIACGALGMVFGGMEVVVVAFAKASGVLGYTGVILMAWAFGSLVAGAVTGTIAWKASPAKRFRLGAASLAVSLVPLIFVSNPVIVALLLMVSGIAIAPTLIASVAVTQASVPPGRLTEALAWTSTGLAAGVAAGAAGLGQVIDIWGWRAGFGGVAGAGLVLIISALFVRSRIQGRRDPPERELVYRALRAPSISDCPPLLIFYAGTLCGFLLERSDTLQSLVENLKNTHLQESATGPAYYAAAVDYLDRRLVARPRVPSAAIRPRH